MFEALFKGVSTRFGLRTIEKSVENPDFIFCSSFQNLRLGSIKFQQTFQNAFPGFPLEALFKGESTRFCLRIVEKCIEHTFQNLRLGSIILLTFLFGGTLTRAPSTSSCSSAGAHHSHHHPYLPVHSAGTLFVAIHQFTSLSQ
jgi:hypothetical protein